MKKDYEKFLSILQHCSKNDKKMTMDYEIQENTTPYGIEFTITITEDKIGFVFNKETGRLQYIFNWKE